MIQSNEKVQGQVFFINEVRKIYEDRKKYFVIFFIVLLLCFSILVCVIYLFGRVSTLHNRTHVVEHLLDEGKDGEEYWTIIKFMKTPAFMERFGSFVNGRCFHKNNSYECFCDPGFTGMNCTENVIYSDCDNVFQAGFTRSGIYDITIPGRSVPLQVYCDMDTDGGKWMVFQRRMDGSVDFYRNWTDYQFGFGRLDGEFWLGLEYLHTITNLKSYQLRVDLEDWNGNTAYASYKTFSIDDLQSDYVLSVGGYSGTAGDSLTRQNNHRFSTKERDNDVWSSNCAVFYTGAWWYEKCHSSNLNGKYYEQEENTKGNGICWYSWKGSYVTMKRAEMKIRLN